MGAARRVKCLTVLLVLLNAGCGAAGTASTPVSPEASSALPGSPTATPVSPEASSALPGSPTASLPDPAGVSVSRPEATSVRATVPADSPSAARTAEATANPNDVAAPTAIATAAPNAAEMPTASSTATPDAPAVPSVTATLADAASLLEAAQNSPFHQFGDDVYTWDDQRRIVILKVPVAHPAIQEIRDLRGHWDGTIEDTPGTRAWVQQCARSHSEEARSGPHEVYGAAAAVSVYSCLGGLAHLAELYSRYWWTQEGVACAANAVMAHSHQGDAISRPLAVCPSIGYDPTVPRPPGWLAEQCEAVVAANPNPKYPADAEGAHLSGDPLPSCWAPVIGVIEAHASEGSQIGLPDSPHDCYHAFLGYVWARQTGRETRPPSDLAIGCHYRAFEAMP